MGVYVDDSDKPFGRMMMCHMIADSHQELMTMVKRMGLSPRWIQDEGTPREHFDICKSKRTLAVAYGAIELSNRELYYRIRRRTPSEPVKLSRTASATN